MALHFDESKFGVQGVKLLALNVSYPIPVQQGFGIDFVLL